MGRCTRSPSFSSVRASSSGEPPNDGGRKTEGRASGGVDVAVVTGGAVRMTSGLARAEPAPFGGTARPASLCAFENQTLDVQARLAGRCAGDRFDALTHRACTSSAVRGGGASKQRVHEVWSSQKPTPRLALRLGAAGLWPLLARITRRGWQRLASVSRSRIARCRTRTLGTRRRRLASYERDREQCREHHVDEAHHGSSHRRGRATPTTSHGGAMPQLRVFTTSPGSSFQRAGEVGKRTKSVRPETSSRRRR